MKKQIIFFLFSGLFLASCSRTVRLSEEDYSWMPYNGDETLIFKSSTGETDTIFLLKKDTLWGYPDPALSTNRYEIVSTFCKHTDSYLRNSKHRYLESYFLKIRKNMNGKAELIIGLSGNDAEYYNLRAIRIDSLHKEQPVTIQISSAQYTDVYLIYPDDYAKNFYNRSSFVTKLYWSKSSGLIRYDKKDGVYWELVKE